MMKYFPGNYSCKFKDKTPYGEAKLIALCNDSMKTNILQKDLLDINILLWDLVLVEK